MKFDSGYSQDVDRGWAFVVMCSAVLSEVITVGSLHVNSIWYAVFLDEFQQSPVTTALAVNLSNGCALSMAIIGNYLTVGFGCRFTVVLGCVMSSVGLAVCSFLKNLTGILIMYGIVTGTGFGIVRLATLSMMPAYFIKYRIIATAVASSGAGFGQFLNSPLLRFLIDRYHWRGAFIVLSAINLNLLVVAAVLMPPRLNKGDTEAVVQESRLQKMERASRICKTLVTNLKVFRDPVFLLLMIRATLILIGVGGFQTHIFNFGRQSSIGLTSDQLTFLPSIVGIGSITGRFVAGGISQIPKVHVILMYILFYMQLVIACIVISFANNYIGVASSCFLGGSSLGANAIIYEVIIHVVGLKQYSSALSYLFIASGTGYFLGGPFAAWIYELDPTYIWSFRILGAVVFTGILLIVPAWLTIDGGKIRQKLSKDELLKQEAEIVKRSEIQNDEYSTHM